jgi:hypothetical protein
MQSDYPRSAALLSEGHCPLCSGYMRISWCPGCRVGWRLDQVDGRPTITPVGRDLTDDEIRRLYNRD